MVSRYLPVDSSYDRSGSPSSETSFFNSVEERFSKVEGSSNNSEGDAMDSKFDDPLNMSAEAAAAHRKQREFIPDAKKDDNYWDRRRRNNEAAKRSREKRRINDIILEQRVMELTKENHILRAQLNAIREKYGISGENLVSMEQIIASMPTAEQVINLTRSTSRSRSFPSPAQIETPIRQSVVVSRVPNDNNIYARGREEYNNVHSSKYAGCRNFEFSPPSNRGEYYSSGDEASPSPQPSQSDTYHGTGMPFKMRHKNHMGDKEAATTLLSLTEVKEEAMNLKMWPTDRNRESPTQSGSVSDSGVSSNDWSNEGGPEVKRMRIDAPSQNEDALRAQLARLASEVESLKYILKDDRYPKAIGRK